MAESTRTKWLEDRDDGNVYLPAQESSEMGPRSLRSHVRAALGLTDECCEKGVGRVYVFVSHGSEIGSMILEASVDLNKIPEVFYVPEVWTEAEQNDWRTLGWRWQLSRICARHGWVQNHIPILPLRLQVHAEQLARPRFEALTLAPVLVFFAPTAYVAPIEEIQSLGKMGRKTTASKQWNFDIEDWSNISQWQCLGVSDVVKKLYDHFWADIEADKSETLFYGSLVRRLTAISVVSEEAEGDD